MTATTTPRDETYGAVRFVPYADGTGYEIELDGTIVGGCGKTPGVGPTGWRVESVVPGAFWEQDVSFNDLGGASLEQLAGWVDDHADDFLSLEDE